MNRREFNLALSALSVAPLIGLPESKPESKPRVWSNAVFTLSYDLTTSYFYENDYLPYEKFIGKLPGFKWTYNIYKVDDSITFIRLLINDPNKWLCESDFDRAWLKFKKEHMEFMCSKLTRKYNYCQDKYLYWFKHEALTWK